MRNLEPRSVREKGKQLRVEQGDVALCFGHEPVDVTAEVVSIDVTDEPAEPKRSLAIRQVLTRQLDASQGLTGELLGAATEISTLLAHSPATVISEIQDGATLPEALQTTRDGLAEDLGTAAEALTLGDWSQFPDGHQCVVGVQIFYQAKFGVTVNALAPGYIDTDMVAAVPEDVLAKIVAKVPVGRLGQADEIARGVAFLCGEDAGFVTGSTLSINGGQHMY